MPRQGLMARRAAVGAAIVLALVMAFQAALVLGAPWGAFTQGGGTVGQLPMGGRIVAGVSLLILALFALALLARVGWGPMATAPGRVVGAIAGCAVGYSAFAGVLNAATPSAGERLVWLPVSIALFCCSLTAVLGTRAGPKASRRRPSAK